jgi:hypothetical protein
MENIMEEVNEQVNTDTPTEGSIQQLRDEFKKIKAENKEYKEGIMNSTLSSLGLEPDKGIGKAVTKLYDGKANAESIKEFVQSEFGEQGNAINAAPEPQVADNVVQAQSRVEQLNKLGVDNKPADVLKEFVNFVNSPETSVNDSLRAKMAMLENDKQQ